MTNEREKHVLVDNYAEHLNVIETLKTRRLISHCSNAEALIKITAKKKITAYLGVDCTADSLHVGHVIPLMVARWLLRFGHNIVILLGGATTRIGDPSGKDKTRPQLEDQVIKNNMESIKSSLEHFLRDTRLENARHQSLISRSGFEWNPSAIKDQLSVWGTVKFVDNAEWFDQIKYVDFLRDYGKYFSVSEMLSLDSVRERLDRELPMNFTEFNYSLLQAYDFLELNRRYDCILQIGGSDQWGNISRGISLGKRFDKELFGITTPLLMNKEGRKMGKTASGAVWLNKDKLSAYDYAMFFRNVPDDLFDDWWGYFTEPNTILNGEADCTNPFTAAQPNNFDRHYSVLTRKSNPTKEKPSDISSLNQAKAVLAERAVNICHGLDIATYSKMEENFGSHDERISSFYPILENSELYVDCLPRFKKKYNLYPPLFTQLLDNIDTEFLKHIKLSVYFTFQGRLPENQIFYDKAEISKGIRLCEVILKMGFAESLGQAKKLMEQGAVTLKRLSYPLITDYPIPTKSEMYEESEAIKDNTYTIGPQHFLHNAIEDVCGAMKEDITAPDNMLWLKVGKKKHGIILSNFHSDTYKTFATELGVINDKIFTDWYERFLVPSSEDCKNKIVQAIYFRRLVQIPNIKRLQETSPNFSYRKLRAFLALENLDDINDKLGWFAYLSGTALKERIGLIAYPNLFKATGQSEDSENLYFWVHSAYGTIE